MKELGDVVIELTSKSRCAKKVAYVGSNQNYIYVDNYYYYAWKRLSAPQIAIPARLGSCLGDVRGRSMG